MKITHTIASLDPAAGGPPQVAVRLAAAQAALGHDVSVLHETPASSTSAVSQMLDKVPGIEAIHQVNMGDTDWVSHVKQQDIMHCHGLWESVLRRSASVARANQIPYVIAPHGMLNPWSMEQKTLKKKLALFLYYRRLLDSTLFIHALNADEAKYIKPHGIASPIEVVANGVFIEEIEPLPEPGGFYKSRPELEGKPFILFLSRLHYVKGLDILAPAFEKVAAELPEVQLVVAGPDEGARADFVAKVNQLGLQDRVHLVGPIYGSAKYEALVDAACFCLPSRQEGFSIAILEALACGTPVLISENCHFPEVATNDAGRVCKLSPEAMGQAMLEMLAEREVSEAMGQRARQLVRDYFTWEAIGKKLLVAYASHLGAGRQAEELSG